MFSLPPVCSLTPPSRPPATWRRLKSARLDLRPGLRANVFSLHPNPYSEFWLPVSACHAMSCPRAWTASERRVAPAVCLGLRGHCPPCAVTSASTGRARCSLRHSGSSFLAVSSSTPSSATPSPDDPVFMAAGASCPWMPPLPEALRQVPPPRVVTVRVPIPSCWRRVRCSAGHFSSSAARLTPRLRPSLRADPVARHPKPSSRR